MTNALQGVINSVGDGDLGRVLGNKKVFLNNAMCSLLLKPHFHPSPRKVDRL